MQEKELDIDLSVHLCYSQKKKEVLQDYLILIFNRSIGKADR